MQELLKAIQSVVQVGAGRGFVVEGRDRNRYVITAAHCLPEQPPATSGSYSLERTYKALVGPLGTTEPKIWVECLFADPVGDIAVLGRPEPGLATRVRHQPGWGEVPFDESEAYEEFTEQAALLIFRSVQYGEDAWVLALDGHWFACRARTPGDGSILITDAAEWLRPGMSGSPILGGDGKVIGMCVLGAFAEEDNHPEGYPNPALLNLPGWFLKEMGIQLEGADSAITQQAEKNAEQDERMTQLRQVTAQLEAQLKQFRG